MLHSDRTVFLCAGTQSSGSTLISWCFLQRKDMDGVLDADNDLLPQLAPDVGRPYAWYKTTISCFRLSELAVHFESEGWRVRPLLIVRDVRDVWSSLSKKPYGANGITAEDPPLRLRLYRFKQDWLLFHQNRWPILKYEAVIEDPEGTLRETCSQLGLPWDDAMLTWPKGPKDIADTSWGNDSFRTTRGIDLASTLGRHASSERPLAIPSDDLNWLESEFEVYNRTYGYPASVRAKTVPLNTSRMVPNFESTRRYQLETRRKPVRWWLFCMGIPNRKLIKLRSFKGRRSGDRVHD